MQNEELFIGREELSARLWEDVFCVQEGYGQCYSLIGPNGIGKTTLIRHLSERMENENLPFTYYFSTVMEDGITFWDYWSCLILQCADMITEEEMQAAPKAKPLLIKKILDVYRFFEENIGNLTDNGVKQHAIVKFNELFRNYERIGIRIILTIDEFDRAAQIFQDGQFFQRLFGMTAKGAARLNLSIVTISRRSVSTIAHHMQEGSNFQDAFPSLTLKGFSNTELETYFASYEKLPVGMLPEHIRQQILFLCGRSPGLLMRMRHEIKNMDVETLDIAEVYSERGSFIRTAYERLHTLMVGEFVDQSKMTPCMPVFIQHFIGPVYTEKIAEEMKRLYEYGMVTKAEKSGDNIFDLAGLTEYRDKDNLIYEPIAPYFVDYVKEVILLDDLKSLAGVLEKTERMVRKILTKEFKEAYAEKWEEVLQKDMPIKENYNSNLRVACLRNDCAARNISVSKLNVLAFCDYYTLICLHWDFMSKYFSLYRPQNELKKDMDELTTCRNTSAHLNLEILNDTSRSGLRGICEFMLKSVEIGENPDKAPTKQANVEIAVENTVSDQDPLIEKVVEMVNIEATQRGGLRGTIAGTNYGVAISPAHLKANNVQVSKYAGKTMKVKITRWDENAQKYNADLN